MHNAKAIVLKKTHGTARVGSEINCNFENLPKPGEDFRAYIQSVAITGVRAVNFGKVTVSNITDDNFGKDDPKQRDVLFSTDLGSYRLIF